MNDSRALIDKIMNEGDTVIPIHARREYRILCEDPGTGRQYS